MATPTDNMIKLGFLLSAQDEMSRVINDAVRKSTRFLNSFEKSAAKASSTFFKAGTWMTASSVIIGKKMFATSKGVAEYANKTTEAAQKTGLAVSDFQGLSYAAEKLYEIEAKRPIEVVLVGIKK